MNTQHHPIQPLALDERGVLRFKANAIVRYVLERAREAGCDLGALARIDFSNEDWQQLAQLNGYSLCGYDELPYVDDNAYEAAEAMVDNPELADLQARLLVAETKLAELKNALREPIAKLYGIALEDLE